MKKIVQNILLSLISLSLTGALLIGIDRLIVGIYDTERENADLIFPHNSKRHLTTSEFSHTVQVNRLGFRDRDFGAKSDDVFRILAIGDSFTYGMGVQIEDSWTKLVEKQLREDGYKVEIANLGRPGAFPFLYTILAKAALPILQPDLVIIAALQGDDLAQSTIRSEINKEYTTIAPKDRASEPPSASRIQKWFPGFSYLSQRAKATTATEDLGAVRETRRLKMMKNMTSEERDKLSKLDPGIRQAFEHDGLNPAMIRLALNQPEYYVEYTDVNSENFSERRDNMAWEFGRIKSIAESHNAEVLILSVPNGTYVSEKVNASKGRIGFITNEDLLTGNRADIGTIQAAEIAKLPVVNVTKEFREFCEKETLYFELDGHFNELGNRRFADAILPLLKKHIPKK
jgi:lysophospholipase L1-like esterase